MDNSNMLKGASSQIADRSYQAAIRVLNTRRRNGRPSAEPVSVPGLDRIPGANGASSDVRGMPSLAGMTEWLGQIGYSLADIDKLNVVHVAGTKGKGSTCAFTESFLLAHGRRTGFPRRTGLYSSPHLMRLEERVRIDARPIERGKFAQYFFEVWDALARSPPGPSSSPSSSSSSSSSSVPQPPEHRLPRYLQLLTLVALHAFAREGVEAAVVETHHGGEYDSTNFFAAPAAALVTPLGMDHAAQLGPTLTDVAWHKAGVFKKGSRAFAAAGGHEGGGDDALQVLRRRAEEKAVLSLDLVPGDDPQLPRDAPKLTPDVQRANAALALAAARWVVESRAPAGRGDGVEARVMTDDDVRKGVEDFTWPGRFQIVREGKGDDAVTWFLDGAHNEMSVGKAAQWFVQAAGTQSNHDPNPPTRVLVFNQISKERDATLVLGQLAKCLKDVPIRCVVMPDFNVQQNFAADADPGPPPDHGEEMRKNFAEVWRRFQDSEIVLTPTVPAALEAVRAVGRKSGSSLQVLVTGSLHLVGGCLYHLEQ